MIIDTHLHLIDQAALRYPWLAGVPALNRDFSYEEYATDALRSGIEAVLHMEVDVDPADIAAETAYVKSVAGRAGSLLRGAIAACRPEEAGFEAYLETVTADPFIKGFRRVLHVVPDDVSEGALFRQNVKRLAGTGLTFDLVV
ncbi:amidohydrolase family protein, partial [Mesorhizobium sp. M2A.F.Ca.ET.039.01.1.1]